MSDSKTAQDEEFGCLTSIYSADILQMSRCPQERCYTGKFIAHTELPSPLQIIGSHLEQPQLQEEFPDREKIVVEHLPPIICQFRVPLEYPFSEESLPDFQILSAWLPVQQIYPLIQAKLESFSKDNPNEGILWHFFEYLEKEALFELIPSLQSGSDFDLLNEVKIWNQGDQAASNESLLACPEKLSRQSSLTPRHIRGLLTLFKEHNASQRDIEFSKQDRECVICSRSRPGKDIFRFPVCDHFFCRSCVINHFTNLIVEGNVADGLACLQCDSKATQFQIKSLLSHELYSRYESLQLQKGLDCMDDVMPCPRLGCNTPVLVDKEESYGVCSLCGFAFCILCKAVYHGVNPCRIKKQSDIIRQYMEGTDEEKELLEKRYSKKQLVRLVEEWKSDVYLDENSKACPKCRSKTEKIDGCNKMTCLKCNVFYCWLCSQILPRDRPYSHFNSSRSECFNRLFAGTPMNNEDDDDFEVDFFQ